jgi:hypothetical protein
MLATNFDQYVSLFADEAPHALVLDWYRRLELTIRDYLGTRGIDCKVGPSAESVIGRDPRLGYEVATETRELRVIRNRVAHSEAAVTPANAAAFARRCFCLIGLIWKAQDAHHSV